MMKRFLRWLRSIFGGAIDTLEDPEKILQQNIRDMNDQIPVMNENIAMVKANVNLSQSGVLKLKAKEIDLGSKIKASLMAGNREIARSYAVSLEQTQADIVGAEANLDLAKKSLEKAMRVKEAFLAERDRKIKEALRAISLAKQAEWQNKVAKTMETFEVADIDQTHDEMIRKIEEKVAKAQARLEMAMESKNIDQLQIEREAEKLRAEDTLRQFEIELGLVKPEAAPAEKTLGPAGKTAAQTENVPAEESAGTPKTMGQEKTKS